MFDMTYCTNCMCIKRKECGRGAENWPKNPPKHISYTLFKPFTDTKEFRCVGFK